MTKKAKVRKPGDIVAYRRKPRDGEILCHNHVGHTRNTEQGVRGFRWFSAVAGGDWEQCPCGWRPDLGTHYALPFHVEAWRFMIADEGGDLNAVYRLVEFGLNTRSNGPTH
jgi:hypothetical protein